MNIKSSKVRAFTLIELLIVIAIIAILTGIILVNLTSSRGKARDAKRISDIGNIQLALELYFDRCKEYPNTIPLATAASNGCPVGSGITLATYMSAIPTSPSPGSYDYATLTFTDSFGSKVINYALHTTLEYTNEVVKDSLPSTYFSSPPTGSSWSSTPTCDQTVNYCLSSK